MVDIHSPFVKLVPKDFFHIFIEEQSYVDRHLHATCCRQNELPLVSESTNSDFDFHERSSLKDLRLLHHRISNYLIKWTFHMNEKRGFFLSEVTHESEIQ